MKIIRSPFVLFFALIMSIVTLLSVANVRADYTILHNFDRYSGDVRMPYRGSLIVSDSTLYGMTSQGGSYEQPGWYGWWWGGTLFKINTDGTGHTILHDFPAFIGDGSNPFGSPILSGSTLYGMTAFGGSYQNPGTGGWGTLFKINTDGADYTILHNFGNSGDGTQPLGSPVLSGSTLYGMTGWGGTVVGWWGVGTLFKMNTDGTDYTILHNFHPFSGDGAWPHFNSPIVSGSTLYGMTTGGGIYGAGGWGWWNGWGGTLFRMNTDGADYTILHHFGGSGDGSLPWGDPILSGSTLYGMTGRGGIYDGGTLFKMNTDGADYTILYHFGGNGDGHEPLGSLILSGSTLYGMTNRGGIYGGGVLFKMNTDGADYTIIHHFGGNGDGAMPVSSLILSGSALYGMTNQGGSNGTGVLFRYTLSEGMTVTIDIKPGSYPNSINLSSKGVVPVAVLTTDEFDAMTIDSGTVMFAGASVAHSVSEDVNGDGSLDMVFHFDTRDLQLDSASTTSTLNGKTIDGVEISGYDSVRLAPKGK